MKTEIELRKSTLTEVDPKLRLIDLMAVPWEQETEIFWRGEVWNEVFTRGAFSGLEDHVGRVRVNREHRIGDTVGKLVHVQDAEDGLLARVKVAETVRGDETLALAEEDMLSPSVGFRVNSPRDMQINRRTRARRIIKAFMDHLSMVEQPAYVGAKVLAVRAEQPAPPTEVETPIIDGILEDPLIQWAAERTRRHEPAS